MNTLQILHEVKIAIGKESDYAASKALNVTTACVSRYRNHGGTMDDKTAMRAAEITGHDPAEFIAWSHAQRSKSHPQAAVWRRIAARFRHAAAVVFMGILAGMFPPPDPAEEFFGNIHYTQYTRTAVLLVLTLAGFAALYIFTFLPLLRAH